MSRAIARALANYDDPRSPASRMRARRAHHLLGLIEAAHTGGPVRILDVGGTRRYWNALPEEALDRHDVRVTLLNLPGSVPPPPHPRFTFVEGDACALPYADLAFDIAHANSVIEHVGSWAQMQAFAAEIQRVAPSYLVQTPHFWFPIEPHAMTPFFHWLPEPARVALVRRFALGFWQRQPELGDAVTQVQGAHLLDEPMMRALFADGVMHIERVLGVPKSILMVRGQTSSSR